MLIPFRSKACGEFLMFDHHAKTLFELIDKPFSAQGIITAAHAAQFAQRLDEAVNDPKRHTDSSIEGGQAKTDEDIQYVQDVGLKQRAWPLIDMLRRAAAKNVDVVWGTAP